MANGEEEQHYSRRGCNGDRMPTYLRVEAVQRDLRIQRGVGGRLLEIGEHLNRIMMIRLLNVLICVCMAAPLLAEDLIVTRTNQEYRGQIIKVVKGNYAIRTTDGNLMALPGSKIARIYRGNRLLDFEEGMSYLIQKKHPYLPFAVLGLGAGAYAVDRYKEYNRRKDRYNQQVNEPDFDPELQNVQDNSGKALAECVIAGLFSAGSFYMAFRPLEVKIPTGKIRVSAVPNRVLLSYSF